MLQKNKITEFQNFLSADGLSFSSDRINFLSRDEVDTIFCALAGLIESEYVSAGHESATKNEIYKKTTSSLNDSEARKNQR